MAALRKSEPSEPVIDAHENLRLVVMNDLDGGCLRFEWPPGDHRRVGLFAVERGYVIAVIRRLGDLRDDLIGAILGDIKGNTHLCPRALRPEMQQVFRPEDFLLHRGHTSLGGNFFQVVLHFNLEGVSERERSEEHTSELQSQSNLVCRLLLEKKKNS